MHTHKWVMAFTAACECGAKEQTAEYVIIFCPIYHHRNGVRALSAVNKILVTWLTETCPAIQWTLQLPSILTKRRRERIKPMYHCNGNGNRHGLNFKTYSHDLVMTLVTDFMALFLFGCRNKQL